MCTYNITLNDSLVAKARPAFSDDEALKQWIEKRLSDYATHLLTLSVQGEEGDIAEIEDDITDEERAYWAESIEQNLLDIAKGTPREYVSSDDFWTKFEDAVMSRYEGVQA